MSSITPDQVNFYQKNGYHLHYKLVLTPADFSDSKPCLKNFLRRVISGRMN